jgi:hypothetical protein
MRVSRKPTYWPLVGIYAFVVFAIPPGLLLGLQAGMFGAIISVGGSVLLLAVPALIWWEIREERAAWVESNQ